MAWKKSLDWVNLVLGLWLIAIPWAMGVSLAVAFSYTAIVLGICLTAVSVWALVQARKTVPEWSHIVLGVLLFVSPWAFRYSGVSAAAWNAWIVGAAEFASGALAFIRLRNLSTGGEPAAEHSR